MPTNGNAGAALAAYGARGGHRDDRHLSRGNARDQHSRDRGLWREVWVADGQIDECGRWSAKGAAQGRWFDCSTLKEPYRHRGQEDDGARACRATRLEVARRDILPDRRRHRPDRHVEGVRRDGGHRPDRARAAADVCGAGRGLRADGSGVRTGRRVRRALGGRGDRRDRDPSAQGGRRFPDPRARCAKAAARRSPSTRRRSCKRSRMPRATTECCSAPRAARCSPAGGRRSSGAGRARTSASLLFNCANGNKYPLPDRSRRLKLATSACPSSLNGKSPGDRWPSGFPCFPIRMSASLLAIVGLLSATGRTGTRPRSQSTG